MEFPIHSIYPFIALIFWHCLYALSRHKHLGTPGQYHSHL